MASNKAFRLGPVAIASSAANICNPGTTTGGVNSTASPYGNLFILLRHIRIVNTTSGAVTFSLYIGATGGSTGGTEFIGTALSIAPNSGYDWYGQLRLDVGDFLSGLASAGSSLTIVGEGEIGVA